VQAFVLRNTLEEGASRANLAHLHQGHDRLRSSTAQQGPSEQAGSMRVRGGKNGERTPPRSWGM
jgi:hypothetical protein